LPQLPKPKLPRPLRLQLERSRFFAQSPQLILLDKLMRKKRGIKVDSKIYEPEFMSDIGNSSY